MVILKNGIIVAGASSYTRYNEGIEIEVDTIESERRKHLATIACSALILNCLGEGLYPSWDAQNMNSVNLAEKLGYELICRPELNIIAFQNIDQCLIDYFTIGSAFGDQYNKIKISL